MNSRRQSSGSFVYFPIESRKRETCSSVFLCDHLTFEILAYFAGNFFSATLFRYGGFWLRVFGAVVALSCSSLNMTPISTFLTYKEGSLEWSAGRLIAEQLSALADVIS